MKKLIVVLAVLILAAGLFLVMKKKPASVMSLERSMKAGSPADDFILGMRDSVTYSLKDFLGRYIVVLAFTDAMPDSGKFNSLYFSSIASYIGSRKDILWFNIKKEKFHAVIEEKSALLNLRYRTLYSNIPGAYRFPSSPAVLIIDPKGIVQFVYVGFSPTIQSDIIEWLRKIKK